MARRTTAKPQSAATTAAPPANGATMMVSKIRAKALGNPKTAAGFSDEEMAAGKIFWLGTIVGQASGTKVVKDPKDETIINHALTGFFEGRPSDDKKPVLKSGVCWLPGGIHEMLVEQVQSAGDGAVVPFAIRIGTRRDSNVAGYSYVTENLLVVETSDPLEGLRAQLGKQLALPAS